MNNPKLRWCGNALIGIGLVLLAWAIGLTAWPKSYSANVRIKVEKNPVFGLGVERSGFDPYWVQTEFETIQSKVVLYRVITNLHLAANWGRRCRKPVDVPTAYAMLKRMMDVRQTQNSSLIQIEVRSHDSNEPMAIANEVAKVYRDYVRENDKAACLRGMKTLEEELAKQAELTNQVGAALAALPDQSSLEALRKRRDLDSHTLIYTRLEKRLQTERNGLTDLPDRVVVLGLATPPARRLFPSRQLVIGSWFVALTSISLGIVLKRRSSILLA